MADLQVVDFALMPGPVRKEKQFGLPDDFSKIDVTIVSRTSHPACGFAAVFRVFTIRADRCSVISKSFLHVDREARNFNISALRGILEVEIVAH